jgi:hypothetical protein
MLIADKDESEAKDERHAKLKTRLKDRFVVHARREMENLLLPTTIALVLKEYEGEMAELNSITYDAYANELLGEFIEEKWLAKKLRKGTYAAKSGTLSDKLKFCDRAIEQLKDFSDLSPEAQNLAESMFVFIKASNTR